MTHLKGVRNKYNKRNYSDFERGEERNKQIRFCFFITPEEKSSLIMASYLYKTQVVKDFMINAALVEAKKVLEEHPELFQLEKLQSFPKSRKEFVFEMVIEEQPQQEEVVFEIEVCEE